MKLQETIFEKLLSWSFQDHLNHLDRKDLTHYEIFKRWKPPVDLLAAQALIMADAFRARQRLFRETIEEK